MPSLETVLFRAAEITTIGNYPLFWFKNQNQIFYKKINKKFSNKSDNFLTHSCNGIFLEHRYL